MCIPLDRRAISAKSVNTSSFDRREPLERSPGDRRPSEPDCFLIFLGYPARHPPLPAGVFVFTPNVTGHQRPPFKDSRHVEQRLRIDRVTLPHASGHLV
jgi:hypothetical protein